ncbi:hypothetical protein ACOAOT_23960 [Lacrimispora sp. AGF001]|uniref:hypothetical protein n=1 Tax=Lacrimispora sp. AGF001 TaxID=3401631 RepID=UPI003B436A15
MNHETIKVGEVTYNIANGSCSLHLSDGGMASVAIIIGTNIINDIHKNLSANSTITKYTTDGVEEWQRSDLVYTGEVKLKNDFPVGIEQQQTGTDDEGNPVFSNVEATADVVIVEYRTPNIQDKVREQEQQINDLNAQVAYLQMMSTPKEV